MVVRLGVDGGGGGSNSLLGCFGVVVWWFGFVEVAVLKCCWDSFAGLAMVKSLGMVVQTEGVGLVVVRNSGVCLVGLVVVVG